MRSCPHLRPLRCTIRNNPCSHRWRGALSNSHTFWSLTCQHPLNYRVKGFPLLEQVKGGFEIKTCGDFAKDPRKTSQQEVGQTKYIHFSREGDVRTNCDPLHPLPWRRVSLPSYRSSRHASREKSFKRNYSKN